MLHKIILQLICLEKSVVLFHKGALSPYAVRHVDKGQHGLRIRQRNDRIIEDEAGKQFQCALPGWPLIIETGYELAEGAPAVRPVVGWCAGGFDGADVRSGFGLFGSHAPQRPECRVRQANTTVRTEHGDPLGQMVDGFALHFHQCVVAHLQIDLLGQVFENPGCATLRMGRRNHPQCLAVGQVPEIGLGIERTVYGERHLLPVLPVELLGQFAGGAQPVEKL